MNASLPLIALAVALIVGVAVGALWRSRQGKIRLAKPGPSAPDPHVDELAGHGVGSGEPVVMHFSAAWCAPCSAARAVIQSVTAEGRGRDVELDLDEHSALARKLGVLSLPTTLVYNGEGTLVARIAGVPKADKLRALL
ncbi:alkyl hydroperoxide reductase/ Thiol specific antioxidant/ Mal allergen [Segniliparus rotundus DSM 44985]|uniref:Alkyl hydroperoxide reductase/ Thiol specific antioxidant/ Mal allergen n=1 Tax=Segniliparus rotundus (strain ATCC BAA-972 / CDC 1076 / CIP 108378 / DSM 44985 / JCM 13578) TaxID=640132 RepID=D6ZEJ8_SEGRD|nr:thioredoxin family protein [Segniliparus rotundus]ADG99474.1 alkyl hydroperoxide reductase/ Thiol specific antioxidant/ Mal allergen [Segniliparus rotundus DSM 44985]